MGPIVFSSLAFALALSASAAPLKPRQLSGACMPTFNNSLVNIQSTSDNTLYWVAEYVTNSGFSNVTVTNAFGPTSEEYGDWNITVDQSGFFQISNAHIPTVACLANSTNTILSEPCFNAPSVANTSSISWSIQCGDCSNPGNFSSCIVQPLATIDGFPNQLAGVAAWNEPENLLEVVDSTPADPSMYQVNFIYTTAVEATQ